MIPDLPRMSRWSCREGHEAWGDAASLAGSGPQVVLYWKSPLAILGLLLLDHLDAHMETWRTIPKKLISRSNPDACLVHIYPTSSALGSRIKLKEQALLIGRGEDCDIQIQDNLVSRRHARIDPSPKGYSVSDLKSTNGTFVNEQSIPAPRVLQDGDYLRIGNCIYRFLAGGNVEAEYHEEIYRLTIIDGLTHTFNKRYLMEFVEREVVRAVRHHRPLSLAMIDIDWFKRINDDWGHLVGDFILRELARLIGDTVRREDLFARYGGEEFALVLVETDLTNAKAACERIRQMIQRHTFSFEDNDLHVTISCGVAECNTQKSSSVCDLIKQADDNLYEAKRAGRNRVVG